MPFTGNRPNWIDTRFAMAHALALRSLCSRDQVGAIITDANNKVIGEGYNGPPKGFWHYNEPCIKWCPRAMKSPLITAETSGWCAPSEMHYDMLEPQLHGDYSDCPSLHAEANALMMADRSLCATGSIFVTSHMCMNCAKLVANSGIAKVFIHADRDQPHRNSNDVYKFLVKCRLVVNINGEWIASDGTRSKV